MGKLYTEKQVVEIAKEAVGLWRRSEHDKRLYQSNSYFGEWIKQKLKREQPI